MIRKQFWMCVFMLVLIPAAVFATSAHIVRDETTPGCKTSAFTEKYCHALELSFDNKKTIKYTIKPEDGLEPDSTYTVSFIYKVVSGSSFDFAIDEEVSSLIATDWETYSETITTPESENELTNIELRFSASKIDPQEKTLIHIDELQFVKSPESTKFLNLPYEVGCCPADFCWTGGLIPGQECIHDDFYEKNVSQPPIGWKTADFKGNNLRAPSGYRCIDGEWRFSKVKYTPLYDAAGFCEYDTQCFKGGGTTSDEACINSGEFTFYPSNADEKESYYCYEGNWTTRTQEIAQRMLNDFTTEEDTYTIFCDSFTRSLNPDKTGLAYRTFAGEPIYTILQSDFVSEFCVMDLNGKIMAGVSLNLQDGHINTTIDDEGRSILSIIKGTDDPDYCKEAIENPDGNYNDCGDGDIKYNAKLKSVIFGRTTDPAQRPQITQDTFIGQTIKALQKIIRNILDIIGIATFDLENTQQSNLDFVAMSGSFDKLYISHVPTSPITGKSRDIRAIRETRATWVTDEITYKTFLSAEYHNYKSNICNYFEIHNEKEIRDQISLNDRIKCTPVIYDDGTWMFSVYVESPVFDYSSISEEKRIWSGAADNFWNDITAKIRTQETTELQGSIFDTNKITFSISPSSTSVGRPTTFELSSDEKDIPREDILGMTWHFDDGQKASERYDVSVEHKFNTAGDHNVKLCLMNKNFRISCSDPVVVNVIGAPTLTISEEYKQNEEKIKLTIHPLFTRGVSPYTFTIDWDDGTEPESVQLSNSIFHTYEQDNFIQNNRFLPRTIKTINISGNDNEGVGFETIKSVLMEYSVPEEYKDNDGDGFVGLLVNGEEEDCDDSDPEIYPGAEEKCDGKDNDCSGDNPSSTQEDNCECVAGQQKTCGPGINSGNCYDGTQTCLEDGTWSQCSAVVTTPEDCNAPGDEDCDGKSNNLDPDCFINCQASYTCIAATVYAPTCPGGGKPIIDPECGGTKIFLGPYCNAGNEKPGCCAICP